MGKHATLRTRLRRRKWFRRKQWPAKQIHDPSLVRALVKQTGWTARAIAARLRCSERLIRYWLSGTWPIPAARLAQLEDLATWIISTRPESGDARHPTAHAD